MESRLGIPLVLGVVLGLAGALLDFYSGYLILTQSGMGGMLGGTVTGLAWGVGISVLGVMLLVTAVASTMPVGRQRMKAFGGMMLLYGFVMLLIGASMYSGVTPMMTGATTSGVGMLAVGALMIANGAMMSRSRAMMASVPGTGLGMKTVYLTIVGILIVGAGLVGVLSVGIGSGTGMQSTTTSTNASSTSSAQVLASAESCSGSGANEMCTMTLTNSGSSTATISGAGTLTYNGAGAMGVNSVSTTSGCAVVSGSLAPGQSAQVRCTFTVNQLARSGIPFSGTVALGDGSSAQFTGTAS
ncbi:MAG TPA: hypothetical protein VFE91_03000 [Nitrososphaerales archaeon]|nr:hypothetical protein [Nitrososphaerales archaeon]